MCSGKPVQTLLEAVGEDRDDAKNFRAGIPQSLHHLNAASGSGDQVFHHHYLLALFQPALDAVLTAMVLVAGADIAHGQIHEMTHNGGVSDACGGGAHQHLGLWIVGADQLRQSLFHVGADGGGGQSQTVVAVDGTFDAAGPGEGLVRS